MVLIFVIPKLCGLGVWGWGGSKVWVEVSAVIESYGIMWLLVCLCVCQCANLSKATTRHLSSSAWAGSSIKAMPAFLIVNGGLPELSVKVCVCVSASESKCTLPEAFFMSTGAFSLPLANGGCGPAQAGRCLDHTCTLYPGRPGLSDGWASSVPGDSPPHPTPPQTLTLQWGWWMAARSCSPHVVTSSRCSPIMFIGWAFIFRWHTPVSSQTRPESPSIHRALGGRCTTVSASLQQHAGRAAL